ncbi:MAG: ferritin-like domain-containing protein [Pseudomonadota bacterium]
MQPLPERWDQALLAILKEGDASAKAARAEAVLAAREGFDLSVAPQKTPPARPARPIKPELVPPQNVPRRGIGSPHGRAALLHALAHIELNAVDLAADMALRFACEVSDDHRAAFVSDWIQVAGEEGLHFRLLSERLASLDATYGDFPAHDGLWNAAQSTSGDLLARLAIAPMILEARGLDVTPGIIEKLNSVGDEGSAQVLTRIYNDEIGHVRTGVRWFTTLAGEDPEAAFLQLVEKHFPSGPKPPFNVWAREQAELPQDWYEGAVPL